MLGAISACIVKGHLVLMTIGGQPIQETTETFFVRQSQPEYAGVNRVKEKTPYFLRKDNRGKRNVAAKRNHNKWRDSKRK